MSGVQTWTGDHWHRSDKKSMCSLFSSPSFSLLVTWFPYVQAHTVHHTNTHALPFVPLSIFLQVKELGLTGFNCSCLAVDAQKMFEVYWDVAKPPSSLPEVWPENYTAAFNSTQPASITVTNQTSAEVYWAVSSLYHREYLRIHCCYNQKYILLWLMR